VSAEVNSPPQDPTHAGFPGSNTFEGSENSSLHELRTLVLSRHAGIAIETGDEERATALLVATARDLGVTYAQWSISQGMTFPGTGNFVPDSQTPAKALKAIDSFAGNGLFVMMDFSRHLDDPAVARHLRELLERFATPPSLSTVVILDAHMQLPQGLDPNLLEYDLKLPNQTEYEQAIRSVIEGLLVNRRAKVELSADQVPQLAESLRGLTLNQARRAVAKVAVDDGRLSLEDLAALVEIKAEFLERGGLLEFMPAESLEAELGGFHNLSNWLDRQRVAFSPEARQLNLPVPKGVMLVGVQGCGKSLAAKAIARSWSMPLVRLDMGRLYDKFIGESEKNFRQAIAVAESLSPAVLWIDEIEKAIGSGGGSEADGGLSQRIFGAFLTWLQEKQDSVFVVATANDLSRLPPELMRKGRFDEIFFVDLPDVAERAEIFRIHLMFRKQDPASFDLAALSAATAGFSGAEIEHVVITAMLDGLQKRKRPDTADLVRVAGTTIPLSTTRREEIEKLRALAQGRFVPVR
jgi:SpoVK/Ycf46/Vps4 family AAA+-type ATPase